MRAFVGIVAAALIATNACAQNAKYPAGPITLVVPYAPGGSGDILGRLLAGELQKRLSQPVIVENRPGGSEITATELLARSNPDGYTLAVLSNALSINEASPQNKKYDIARDLAPIAKAIDIPFAMLVAPKLQVTSLAELVKLAKAQPGKLNYAHLGPGTPHYITMEWFKRAAGIDVLGVPYRSSAQSYTALLTDEVQVVVSGLGPTLPFIESGQAKAVVSMTRNRPKALPDTPTITEAGYPDFNLLSWMGVFARAGTPDDRLQLLSDEITRAVESDEVKARLLKLGLEPSPSAIDKFPSFVQQDIQHWGGMTKATLGQN
jgi:tripartite-type tricarboxylate transporter receptor subunit TctC